MGGVRGSRIGQRIPSLSFIYLLIFVLKVNTRSRMVSSFDKLLPRLRLSGRPQAEMDSGHFH